MALDLDGLADLIAETVKGETEPLKARVADLEARVAEAETKGIVYAGVFQRAADYRRGSVVTHSGCAWVAIKDTQGEAPGAGESWQLMVKAGKDARS